eukprot:4998197-Pleurochrysis_carterae.AAC.1
MHPTRPARTCARTRRARQHTGAAHGKTQTDTGKCKHARARTGTLADAHAHSRTHTHAHTPARLPARPLVYSLARACARARNALEITQPRDSDFRFKSSLCERQHLEEFQK